MDNETDSRKERKEKNRVRREKLAGYFYDISKLSFTGLVIGVLLPLISNTHDISIWLAAIMGLVLTIVAALLADNILK